MTNLEWGLRPKDIEFTREGPSMVTAHLKTDAAKAWIDANVETEDWQWLGPNTLAGDVRCMFSVCEAMIEAGFNVE